MSEMPIIVVGAGQAGLQVVDSLRRGGHDGPLVLIGDEASLPYQRPPLSKQYMSSDMSDERLLFRPADYYAKNNVEVLLGAQVSEISTQAQSLTVDGKTLNYAKLALTTGASVRRLPVPGAEDDCVCYLRSIEDAQFIRAKLTGGPQRVVAIGGGFIGLEIAASARELGQSVTVIEAQDRLMARVVAPLVSDYCLELHRAHGVDVLLDAAVSRIGRAADGSAEVVLADERSIPADIIIVGIGSIPHSELAQAAGLDCDNGIVVDEFAQTSDLNIVAAGDCTMHKNARLDVCHRLESVQNAVDQAKIAAATLLGQSKPYEQIPWFWSDQFSAKLQMVGSSAGFDRTVLRGSLEDDAFSVFYFRDERLIGVDSINRPSDHVVSRKLLAAGSLVPDEIIADLDQNLKTLL
jgi:3-phenylpropionate/trans-cinnamate dioxygenase ferredoxin reductase subunit